MKLTSARGCTTFLIGLVTFFGLQFLVIFLEWNFSFQALSALYLALVSTSKDQLLQWKSGFDFVATSQRPKLEVTHRSWIWVKSSCSSWDVIHIMWRLPEKAGRSQTKPRVHFNCLCLCPGEKKKWLFVSWDVICHKNIARGESFFVDWLQIVIQKEAHSLDQISGDIVEFWLCRWESDNATHHGNGMTPPISMGQTPLTRSR